jgi:hypothetical protein
MLVLKVVQGCCKLTYSFANQFLKCLELLAFSSDVIWYVIVGATGCFGNNGNLWTCQFNPFWEGLFYLDCDLSWTEVEPAEFVIVLAFAAHYQKLIVKAWLASWKAKAMAWFQWQGCPHGALHYRYLEEKSHPGSTFHQASPVNFWQVSVALLFWMREFRTSVYRHMYYKHFQSLWRGRYSPELSFQLVFTSLM